MITVDFIDYDVTDPWPELPADSGRSIERIELSEFGSEGSNWKTSNAVGGSPGSANSTGTIYEIWEAEIFTPAEIATGNTTPAADFNGDGLINLLSYAYGFDPRTTPEPEILPEVTVVDVSGAEFLGVRFRRNSAASDVTFSAQVSIDLTTWTSATMQSGLPADNGDGTADVVFRSSAPIANDPRRFIRSTVSLN